MPAKTQSRPIAPSLQRWDAPFPMPEKVPAKPVSKKARSPSSAEPEPAPSLEGSPSAGWGAPAGMPQFLQASTGYARAQEGIQRKQGSGSDGGDGGPRIPVRHLVNTPGDSFEVEADRIASLASAPTSPISLVPGAYVAAGKALSVQRLVRGGSGIAANVEEADARLQPPDPGSPVSERVRSRVEPLLGVDLGSVRVHASPKAQATAGQLNARAFTHGRDIWLGAGERADDVSLMAHEATHVAQQAAAPGGTPPIQRQDRPTTGATSSPAPSPSPDAGTAAPTAASLNIVDVPADRVRRPGASDVLVVTVGDRLLALPAAGNMVRIAAPTGVTIPVEPLFTVPTVAKEGLIGVRVEGNVGFMIDAGGSARAEFGTNALVVFPAALSAIQSGLGISSVRGAVVTHIHEDHVRNLVEMVRANSIRPANLLFPEAFDTGSGTFPSALRAIRADPNLQALGHGTTATYGVIRTPAGGSFFRHSLAEGEVTFDFYGLTRAMEDLASQRTAGRSTGAVTVGTGSAARRYGSLDDTASLLTRVTHRTTGTSVLFMGDLRGEDLTRFRTAMGDGAYNEMLAGVTVLEGFQHHMGALESSADRAGLIDLVTRTYLRSGRLTIVAQTQEVYGRSQFVNESLVRALRDIGADVYLAGAPAAPASGGIGIGTVTIDNAGGATTAGPNVRSLTGEAAVQSAVGRLLMLRRAAEVLNRYERFLEPVERYGNPARAAHDTLETALRNFIRVSIEGVQTGAAGRGSSTLTPAAAADQATLLTAINLQHPVESDLTPATMRGIEELNRRGPHLETLEREMRVSRERGRMTEAAMEALWELDPEEARRLVRGSGLSRRERSRVMGGLPGQPFAVRTRIAAGFMVVVTVANELAPLIEAHNADAREENVGAAIDTILWWQSKSVHPRMRGVSDQWFDFARSGDTNTTDTAAIQTLLNNGNLDYLVLESISDTQWDAFMIWMSANVRTYPDWEQLIVNSTAVRGEGPYVDQKRWSYRKGTIRSTFTGGFAVDVTWEESARLSTILNAAASAMVDETRRGIRAVEEGPGPTIPRMFTAPGTFISTPIYADTPRARPGAHGALRKTFGPSATNALYTLARQRRWTDVPRDSVFYVFPNSASPNPVPEGYVVVGGADFNTFTRVYSVEQEVTEEGENGSWTRMYRNNPQQIMLARERDLVDAPAE